VSEVLFDQDGSSQCALGQLPLRIAICVERLCASLFFDTDEHFSK